MYLFHEKGVDDDSPSWASMQGTARRTDVSTVLAGKPTVPRATNTHNLLTLHPLYPEPPTPTTCLPFTPFRVCQYQDKGKFNVNVKCIKLDGKGMIVVFVSNVLPIRTFFDRIRTFFDRIRNRRFNTAGSGADEIFCTPEKKFNKLLFLVIKETDLL